MSLASLSALLGSASGAPSVRPPERTLVDLERYLIELADHIAIDGSGEPSIFAPGLWRSVLLVREARDRGLSYSQAEQAWKAAIEREHDAANASQASAVAAARRASQEREDVRRGRRRTRDYRVEQETAEDILGYAAERLG